MATFNDSAGAVRLAGECIVGRGCDFRKTLCRKDIKQECGWEMPPWNAASCYTGLPKQRSEPQFDLKIKICRHAVFAEVVLPSVNSFLQGSEHSCGCKNIGCDAGTGQSSMPMSC